MGGGIPKTAQNLEAVGENSEDSREDRSNGAGPGRDVQGSGAVVLLYGSKIWVETGDMLKVLTVFHHLAVRQITRMTTKGGSTESGSIQR